MSKYKTSPNFLARIPHAIEPHWDPVWAPHLAGFPLNIVYAANIGVLGWRKQPTFSILALFDQIIKTHILGPR